MELEFGSGGQSPRLGGAVANDAARYDVQFTKIGDRKCFARSTLASCVKDITNTAEARGETVHQCQFSDSHEIRHSRSPNSRHCVSFSINMAAGGPIWPALYSFVVGSTSKTHGNRGYGRKTYQIEFVLGHDVGLDVSDWLKNIPILVQDAPRHG